MRGAVFRFGTGFAPLNTPLSEFNRNIESKLKKKEKLQQKEPEIEK